METRSAWVVGPWSSGLVSTARNFAGSGIASASALHSSTPDFTSRNALGWHEATFQPGSRPMGTLTAHRIELTALGVLGDLRTCNWSATCRGPTEHSKSARAGIGYRSGLAPYRRTSLVSRNSLAAPQSTTSPSADMAAPGATRSDARFPTHFGSSFRDAEPLACAPHATPTLPSHFALEQAALRRRETVSLISRAAPAPPAFRAPPESWNMALIMVMGESTWGALSIPEVPAGERGGAISDTTGGGGAGSAAGEAAKGSPSPPKPTELSSAAATGSPKRSRESSTGCGAGVGSSTSAGTSSSSCRPASPPSISVPSSVPASAARPPLPRSTSPGASGSGTAGAGVSAGNGCVSPSLRGAHGRNFCERSKGSPPPGEGVILAGRGHTSFLVLCRSWGMSAASTMATTPSKSFATSSRVKPALLGVGLTFASSEQTPSRKNVFCSRLRR
mmetsp:Transcript_6666/g.20087  ORF Transcript_6666/g.20087 Transcript_6666/m.20087 type:complete len:448 (+) Transcript_6666:207-1550(+)